MSTWVIRVIMFFAVFGLVVTLPWWLSVAIVIALAIYFPLYIEALFFGFMLDTLYSVKYSFPYIGLSTALALLLVVYFVRINIRT